MNYTTILTQKDFDLFLESVAFLEDGLIKSISMLNDSYVNQDLSMYGHGADSYNIELFFQNQNKFSPVVFLFCSKVKYFCLDASIFDGLHGIKSDNSTVIYFDGNRSKKNYIDAKLIQYFIVNDKSYLGNNYTLGVNKVNNLHVCPCCDFEKDDFVFGMPKECSVCGWVDDILQYNDTSLTGISNIMSLEQARKNFLATGNINRNS